MRKLYWLAVPVLIPVAAAIACGTVSEPRPVGQVGKNADDLAHAMMQRVDVDAWERTKAVTWNFGGRRTHLWDRERNYDLYKAGEREVLLRIWDKSGIARDNGQELTGEEAQKALQEAWESWVNDSFWLNAPSKCFDEGTERSIVRADDGVEHLLVAYSSGGVTPGDAYLWNMGEGLPTSWKMWTHVIPIGGVKTSWDRWQQLATGAWISTLHEFPTRTLELTDVRGSTTLAELVPGADPFAALEATN
ncbi:MAG TPA: hypothetical protein VLC93_10555 [Myxococcota bacterium]|nr:hypothetical protein [Myxococcota bacterium]